MVSLFPSVYGCKSNAKQFSKFGLGDKQFAPDRLNQIGVIHVDII